MSPTTALQDSGAAYVTKPSGPPDNSGYMYAAYGVALTIYGAYIVLLLRRIARTNRRARGG